MKKVAIQEGLTPIKNYLMNEGYEVQEYGNEKKEKGNFLNKFDAVIVTSEDDNVMGIQNTITKTPIIDANGMTPEQVKSEIEKR